jgi:hypothetical protein
VINVYPYFIRQKHFFPLLSVVATFLKNIKKQPQFVAPPSSGAQEVLWAEIL